MIPSGPTERVRSSRQCQTVGVSGVLKKSHSVMTTQRLKTGADDNLRAPIGGVTDV